MLTAPTNSKGHPFPPSRQLLAQWVVETWEKIPAELVRKSWIVSGYQTTEHIADAHASNCVITEYSQAELGQIVEHTAGARASLHFLHDPENMPDPEFSSDDESESESSDSDGKGWGDD